MLTPGVGRVSSWRNPVAPTGRLDVQAHGRPGPEHVPDGPQLDPHRGHLAGDQVLGSVLGVQVEGPRLGGALRVLGTSGRAQPAALDVQLLAVGAHLDQRDLQVGVGQRGFEPQVDTAGPEQLEVLGQRRGGQAHAAVLGHRDLVVVVGDRRGQQAELDEPAGGGRRGGDEDSSAGSVGGSSPSVPSGVGVQGQRLGGDRPGAVRVDVGVRLVVEDLLHHLHVQGASKPSGDPPRRTCSRKSTARSANQGLCTNPPWVPFVATIQVVLRVEQVPRVGR